MTEDEFWEIVESCFGSDCLSDSMEAFESKLASMSQARVVDFQVALTGVMSRAYAWDLIAAACFLGCGQSDDGFQDFRAWLITRGRADYEKALADPNHIATFQYEESPTEEWYSEDFHMLVGEIGGEEKNEDWPYLRDPETPAGDAIKLTQKSLEAKFPLLWDRFGNDFMIGIP